MDVDITVLTLNCWGIPVASQHRAQRIEAISKTLLLGKYDLVCLQEVWLECDYQLLKQFLNTTLPYSHYFYSGVFGSGLCVFSKYPIQDVFFYQWPLNGYVHKIHHGDWFGGKGIGLCRLKIQNISVNFYTTHLHAVYNQHQDEYLAHRVLQSFDAAQFIRMTSGNCDFVILGGDLNIEPEDLLFKVLCYEADLEDSFIHSEKCDDDCIGTNESSRNSYADKHALNLQPKGKRIDYILFKCGSTVKVKRSQYRLPFPSCIPDCNFSFSDHEAVSTTFEICKTSSVHGMPRKRSDDIENHRLLLNNCWEVCNQAHASLARTRSFFWIVSSCLFIVLLSIFSTSPPFGFYTVYKLILAIISAVWCYTMFMGTVWNRIEVNGIVTGKLSVELALSRLENLENERSHRAEEQLREG